MSRSVALALVAALVWGGCNEEDGGDAPRPATPRQVQGALELPRAEAGAPDAGTRGGHGADRYLLEVAGPDTVVRGRVEPATAAIEIVDETGRRRARANVRGDGSFHALLPDLPRHGVATFRLTATAGPAEPWRTEIVASRGPAASAPETVRVPKRDATPPFAALVLRDGKRVVSSVAPVRPDPDAPLRLSHPELRLTAITRDEDGGTGRIRVSLSYVRRCAESVTRKTLHFPPSEIARVRVAPGTAVPVERRRHAPVRLEALGAGCRIRGKAWADATNASGLESFSDQIVFVQGS